MDVDTRHLRALVAVVDEGTFTDAGIALGTSQASVTRSVQRLERVLGRRLLSRSSRHVEPTDAGVRVLAQARRVLALVDRLDDDAPAAGLAVGYSWGALGVHTLAIVRAWRPEDGELDLVQSSTPTAGLLEGRCDVAVVRTPTTDPRVESVVVGLETRFAALADDHPLATRGRVLLADFAGLSVAIDSATGTTRPDLWPDDARPGSFRETHGVDEWLNLVATGRAVGISSAATVAQQPRPGVTYLPIDDAPPVEVRLLWPRHDRPALLDALVALVTSAYGGATD